MMHIILLVALLAALPAAADVGVKLGANYDFNTTLPANYGGWNQPRVYAGDAAVYVSTGPVLFSVQGWLAAHDEGVSLAGGKIGAGVSLGNWTIGAYHESCHNLDTSAYWMPPCRVNALRVQWTAGKIPAWIW